MARVERKGRVPVAALGWPREEVAQALVALARRTGLSPMDQGLAPGEPPAGAGAFGRWLEGRARELGLELEPTEVRWGEVGPLLRSCAPALLQLPAAAGSAWLAILGFRRGAVVVLTSELRCRRLGLEALRGALEEDFLEDAESVDELTRRVELTPRRRDRVHRLLLAERLGGRRIAGCWLLRMPPEASLWRQAKQVGLLGRFVVYVASYSCSFSALLLSWWVLGRVVLEGTLAEHWLFAWLLLLLLLVPLRGLLVWLRGRLAVAAGALVKRRLLAGAMSLRPGEIRHQGVGQLLGRVLESEAVEELTLDGGFRALVGAIELVFAAFVLSQGSGATLHVTLLGVWILTSVLLMRRFYLGRLRWTDKRFEITHDLVERLIGYRTRLAQEHPASWHLEEDAQMEAYQSVSEMTDRRKALLLAIVPRGWLVLGIVGLLPAFLTAETSGARFAIGLGGLLVAFRALTKLAEGSNHLSGALIAWKRTRELVDAAARRRTDPSVGRALPAGPPALEAVGLTYRFLERGAPVLRGVSLTLADGDRVLVEGRSGCGKSTLASLLGSLRRPHTGTVLMGGLDVATVGEKVWREHVVVVPQFHENHVFTATLGFNLLMGREWPPRAADLRRAERVCLELGLGDLLERMPSGLHQLVGETGWQLSHGEKSRVFIARALLQGAPVLILDESLAALDPRTADRVLECVLERTRVLMLIDHP